MKKLLLILLLFIGLVGVTYASDYTVAGATDPAECNGDYTAAGTYNGQSYYKHNTADYWIEWNGSDTWMITAVHEGGIPQSLFLRINADPIGAYTNNNGSGTVTVSSAAVVEYTVTFHENNNLNGVSINIYEDSGRETEVTGSPITTSGSGNATIDLSAATYYYSASKLYYETTLDSMIVADTDITENFTMVAWGTPTITGVATPTTNVNRNQTRDLLIPGTGFKPGITAVARRSTSATDTRVTVNSTTYISPTSIRLNVTGGNFTSGAWHRVIVTNPDGKTGTRNSTIFFNGSTVVTPDPPTIVTDPISPSNIVLTITPASGSYTVAGYRIEWQNPSGQAYTVLTDNTNQTEISYSIKALYGEDLTSVTTYKFKVRTITNTGTQSAFSNESSATTFAPYTLGKPTGLTEVSTSDTTISCSWTAPVADPPDTPAATDYFISATDISVIDGQTFTGTVGGTTTSYTLTGLTTATSYRVTVAAINLAGVGDASDSETMITTGEARYALTFDELNDLENVVISLYSDSGHDTLIGVLVTDENGDADIDYFDGTYYWTAKFPGYQTLTGAVTIDGGAEDVEFTLIESVFNIVEPLYYDGANFIYKPQKMYVNGAWKIIRKERHEEDE